MRATEKQAPGMLLTSDSSFLFHIGELETAVRCKLPLVCVVGVDYQWGLEVGVYKRTFGQGTAETGTHWGKSLASTRSAKASAVMANTSARRQTSGPAIKRAYASGKVGVVHVDIDPKANSEEMPKYAEFRTWYAEGTQ